MCNATWLPVSGEKNYNKLWCEYMIWWIRMIVQWDAWNVSANGHLSFVLRRSYDVYSFSFGILRIIQWKSSLSLFNLLQIAWEVRDRMRGYSIFSIHINQFQSFLFTHFLRLFFIQTKNRIWRWLIQWTNTDGFYGRRSLCKKDDMVSCDSSSLHS